METKEYELLDGRTIRAKYDRLGMCKISQENLEAFVKEFNASYRQAKILEKIKENYALMKLDERKKGKWKTDGYGHIVCTACNEVNVDIWKSKYCPMCGAEMESEE
jgi:rubrerythrin